MRLKVTGVWKNIVSVSKDIAICNIKIVELSKKELGGDNTTSLWFEDWYGSDILKHFS